MTIILTKLPQTMLIRLIHLRRNFIVMWQQLHDYCWFSIQHLPEKITNICLGVFWVILVRAKYHNRTSALQKRQRSSQLIYCRSHNALASCKRIHVAITTSKSNEWGVGQSKIFAKCVLDNIYLSRDYYHLPTYKNIGARVR